MKKLILIIKKYCYFCIPAVSIIALIALNHYGILIVKSKENLSETIIGISGTLIGFLFTAMTIFFSLNKDSKYMQYLKKFNHHIIFSRLVAVGIASLTLNIVSWLFSWNLKIVVFSFIVGLEETIMAAYYIYVISLNSFK